MTKVTSKRRTLVSASMRCSERRLCSLVCCRAAGVAARRWPTRSCTAPELSVCSAPLTPRRAMRFVSHAITTIARIVSGFPRMKSADSARVRFPVQSRTLRQNQPASSPHAARTCSAETAAMVVSSMTPTLANASAARTGRVVSSQSALEGARVALLGKSRLRRVALPRGLRPLVETARVFLADVDLAARGQGARGQLGGLASLVLLGWRLLPGLQDGPALAVALHGDIGHGPDLPGGDRRDARRRRDREVLVEDV